MPDFGHPFSGLAKDKKLSHAELVRAIRFMVSAEYEAIQLYMQLAESTDNKLAIDVLTDIADEERVHAGEFLRLLKELAVPFQKTEMSFSVRNDAIDLEYNGHTLDTLFAQRKNLVSPSFWRMLMDIVRFNRQVKNEAVSRSWQTLGQYLDAHRFGSLFRDNYLFLNTFESGY